MTALSPCIIPFSDSPVSRAARPSGPSRNIPLVLAIITLAIISRLGMIAWPFLNDSGLYAQLGRTVAEGGVLYRDFYETKLPGTALLASAFWRAFGPHWAGYVICQMCMAFLAAAALARAARRHIGTGLPTFLFAVVFLNLSQAVYTGFQLETIQAFFEALAGMMAVEALMNGGAFAAFAAGLAAGTAAMAKPGGIAVAVALMIVLLAANRKRWKLLVALASGAAIPAVATLFYTIHSGAWLYLPSVIRDIGHYSNGTPVRWDAAAKMLVILFVLGFPFLFGRKKTIGGTPMPLFLILWFILDLTAAIAQRRLYPYHFLPLACPAALLYGLSPRRPLSIAIGLLPIALLSLTWEGSSISQINRGLLHMPVSDYIAAHTTAADTVFIDQIGRLLIESNRKPGSRLGTFFYFVNDDDAPQRYLNILLDDFETRKPKYLVLPGNWNQPVPGLANCQILSQCPSRRDSFIAAWAVLRNYVARHYHQETAMNETTVYRRN